MLDLLKPYRLDLGLLPFFDLLHLHERSALVAFRIEAHGVIIGLELEGVIPCSVCSRFFDRPFAAAHRANLGAGDWLALVAFDLALKRASLLRSSDCRSCGADQHKNAN